MKYKKRFKCVFIKSNSTRTNRKSKNTDQKCSKTKTYSILKKNIPTLKIGKAKSSDSNSVSLSKKEFDRMNSVIQNQYEELRQFKTKEHLYIDAASIYIELLEKSNKVPRLVALELASFKAITKSVWSRIQKNLRFNSIIIDKVCELIKDETNQSRRDLYFKVLMKFYNYQTHRVIKEGVIKHVVETVEDDQGNEIPKYQIISDKRTYNEFNSRNGYLEIDEKIDQDLVNSKGK